MALVRMELKEGVAILTLDLPAKLNAITIPMQVELREKLKAIREDSTIRAAILTGAERAFCVGADLSSLTTIPPGKSVGDQMAEWMQTVSNPMIAELSSLPVPLVCAVNGPAAGAGVGLALCGDLVVAARSAYFYLPFFPRLGLVPDLGITSSLPRLVGRARAMGMALLDERLSADQAVTWGLIWESVDDQELGKRSFEIAGRLAQLPPRSIAEARAAFGRAHNSTLEDQLQYESERQRALSDDPAFREGVNAFLQKRKPVFDRG